MSTATSSAFRYLHANLNCTDVDSMSAFYAETFGLKETMRSGRPEDPPSDGAILGVEGLVRSSAAFVYDARGPRAACANELVEWFQPLTHGEAYAEHTHIGIQAIGYAVSDADAAAERALARGATRCGDPDVSDVVGTSVITVLDPAGVRVDIVQSDGAATRIRHLRQNVHSLDASIPWYEAVGFQQQGETRTATVGDTEVKVAGLRLSDEEQLLLLVEGLAPAGQKPYDRSYHTGLFRSALAVEDPDEALARLKTEGKDNGAYRHDHLLTGTAVGHLRLLIMRDPDNVMVELVQRDRSIFR